MQDTGWVKRPMLARAGRRWPLMSIQSVPMGGAVHGVAGASSTSTCWKLAATWRANQCRTRCDCTTQAAGMLFAEAVWKACEALAEKIVSDGEKITKVVELRINGAASAEDAEQVARAIGNSLLVKTSWYGEDPNWGRLAAAAGYAGAKLVEAKLDILYNDTPAMTAGKPHADLKPKWKEIVQARRFIVTLNLHLGKASFRLLASDLSEGYVNYNKSE